MPKPTKVIKGLKYCINTQCGPNCPYYTPDGTEICKYNTLLRDALELIENMDDKSPRVIGLDELIPDMTTWYEVKNNFLIPALIIPSPSISRHRILSHDRIFIAAVYFPEDENYGKTWRCWDIKPSEKQRNMFPWDKQEDEEDEL